MRFDERPPDSKLIADAKLQHGLPESSEFTVRQPGAGSLRVDVVARRTTWVIENKDIKVGGKAGARRARAGRLVPVLDLQVGVRAEGLEPPRLLATRT